MTVAGQLEEALALALKLAPKERLQLIERVAASVEHDIDAAASNEHWGNRLLGLLDELGSIELAHPEIEDATEWVKTMRREARQRRLGDWGNRVEEDAE